MITLHPRTVSQGYSGHSNWDMIKKLKQKVTIPVVGNGDITSPEDAKKLFSHTHCQGIMIGRAAMRTPWLFADIKKSMNGETVLERTREEKLHIILKHLDLILQYQSERAALHCMTNRIALYGKTLGHVKPLKERVRLAKNAKEIKDALHAWLDVSLVAS